MPKYLGQTKIKIEKTEFKDYTASDWALYFIGSYGQIDGDHHKAWVLDQIVRVLKGTKVCVAIAKWDDGQEEYRISLGKPSLKYLNWVNEMRSGGYEYDEGIAP